MVVPTNTVETTCLTEPSKLEINQFVHPVPVEKAPKTIGEAINLKDKLKAAKWNKAIMKEYNAMKEFGVFKLVKLPKDASLVGSRWLLNIKSDDEKTYKARLVAQGYTQTFGHDFNATYCPVLSLRSFRAVCGYANWHKLKLFHTDISNAFLNANLKHKIYVKQPPGFIDPDNPDFVWELIKALYGLKQCGHEWNDLLIKWLLSIGFIRSTVDSCLLYKIMPNGMRILLGVYVDDLLLGASGTYADQFADQILKRFKGKNLGEVKRFLGMQIERDIEQQKLLIHQRDYIDEILQRFDVSNGKPSDTPLAAEPLTKNTAEEPNAKDAALLREGCGCLNYLAQCTRPDIAVAVSVLSQFVENPSRQHMDAFKRILSYLKGTRDLGIVFDGKMANDSNHSMKQFGLTAFVNSSFANRDVKQSTIGYVLHW